MKVQTSLVRPEVPFVAVHAAFVDAGWTGGPVVRTRPVVHDEPEVARYRRRHDVATYEADPVAWLRVLHATGPPPPLLPLLLPTDVLDLVGTRVHDAATRERVLLGVLGAATLRLPAAVPTLRRLRS